MYRKSKRANKQKARHHPSVRKSVIWFRKASSYLYPHRPPGQSRFLWPPLPVADHLAVFHLIHLPGPLWSVTLLRRADSKFLDPQNPHSVVPITYISPPASPSTPPDGAGFSLCPHLSHHLLLLYLAVFYLYFKFPSSAKLVRTSSPLLLLPFLFLELSALAKISHSNQSAKWNHWVPVQRPGFTPSWYPSALSQHYFSIPTCPQQMLISHDG